MKQLKVGIVGCGTIGGELARKIVCGRFPHMKLSFLNDTHPDIIRTFKESVSTSARFVGSEELIDRSDLVIEAAAAGVSYDIASRCLGKDKKVIIMSVGGLVDGYAELEGLIKRSNGQLHIPSGAVCGIDGILAARESSISEVTLTTRKPVKGLRGAPYFIHKGIDLDEITKDTVVFDGSAYQRIR